jgi:hypothetical protein
MISSAAVLGLLPLRIPNRPCIYYLRGKQTRTPFPKATQHRATTPLALVHSDICGPFRTPSLGGARYFISFINDFSRFTWVYFITRKSEALTKFKTFVAEVTSQGRHIQCLRSDNGGEYKSADFDNYCTLNGISRQFTIPYSPQQTVFLSVATVPSWTSPAVCYLIKTYHIIYGGRLFALPPAFSTYDPPNDTPPKPLLSYLRARSHLSPISESSARKSSFMATSPIEESSIRILRKGSC